MRCFQAVSETAAIFMQLVFTKFLWWNTANVLSVCQIEIWTITVALHWPSCLFLLVVSILSSDGFWNCIVILLSPRCGIPFAPTFSRPFWPLCLSYSLFSFSALLTYCSKNTESIYKNRLAVDLPEFKGKHRKFRNLVSSYLGKCSVQKNFTRYQATILVAFSL